MRLTENIRRFVADKPSVTEDTLSDLETVIDEIKHYTEPGDVYIFAYRGSQGCSLHRASGDKGEYHQFMAQHLFDPKECFAFCRIDVESPNKGTLLEIDISESLQILKQAHPTPKRIVPYRQTSELIRDIIDDKKAPSMLVGYHSLNKGDQLLITLSETGNNMVRVNATILKPNHLLERDLMISSDKVINDLSQHTLLTVHHASGHQSYSSRMDITPEQSHRLLHSRKQTRDAALTAPAL